MKILFFGRLHEKVEEWTPAFRSAGEQLGKVCAERGHTLLVCTGDETTIDHSVLCGVKQFLLGQDHLREEDRRRPAINLHYAACDIVPKIDPNVRDRLNLHRKQYETLGDGAHKQFLAHIGAIEECDIVIVLAGGESTLRAASAARLLGKQVLALKQFGGSASTLYQQLWHAYFANPKIKDNYGCLASDWDDNNSATQIVELAESLAHVSISPHTYFLSYSWEDEAAVDHVETLLRRQSRNVIRDETDFRAAGVLDDSIQVDIGRCDTFIALCSERYNNSRFCPNELDFANESKRLTDRPKRIAYLMFDDSRPPLCSRANLRSKGMNRVYRAQAVEKLIREEQ